MLKEVEQQAVKEDSAEIVAAVRRGRDGEPLPKQTNVWGNNRDGDGVRIDNLITRPKTPIRSGRAVHRQKKKMNEGSKTAGSDATVEEFEQSDVLSGITQANAGISVGQLLRGDLKEATTTAKKLFEGLALSSVLAAKREDDDGEKGKPRQNEEERSGEPQRFKLAKMTMFGSRIMTLFDSDAIPIVIS